MKKHIITAVSTLWVLLIAAFWFKSHMWRTIQGTEVKIQLLRLWEAGQMGWILAPFLAVLIVFGLFILWKWMWHGQKKFEIKLTGLKLTAISAFLGFVFWNAAAFFRDMPGTQVSAILGKDFFPANFDFLIHLFTVLGWIAILLLTFQAIGVHLLRLFKVKPETRLGTFLFEVGLGLGAWSFIVFILGIFGIFQIWTVIGIAIITLALSWRTILKTVLDFCTLTWTFKSSFSSLALWLSFFWIVIILANLTDLIRPIPIGWDDLGTYLNKAQLIAGRHTIVPGGTSFPVELLMSLGYLFSSSAMLSMVISWLGSFLGSLTVFAFGRRFWNVKIGLVAATVWYTLPMVTHISYADMKTDTTLFFISVLAIWSFVEWIKDKKQMGWLWLGSLFTGLAWVIKITTAFLMVGLASLFLWQLPSWKVTWPKKITTALIAAGIFIIPFLPWAIFDMSTNNWQLPSSVIGFSSVNPDQATITNSDWDSLGINPEVDCQGSGGTEELGRYTGHLEGWQKYIRLPWDLTMNTHINDLYLIIGFLFLAIGPLWLLWSRGWSSMSKPAKILTIFTFIYFIFWAWRGLGIPWYGIAMFLPFSLLVATLPYFKDISRHFKVFLSVMIIIGVLAGMILRLERYGNFAILQYAGGRINHDQFVDVILPNYTDIATALKNDPGKVWRTGTFIPYFIADNDKMLVSDDQLDLFSCIDTGQNDAVTLKRIQQLGFKYFILDLNVATIESDPNGSLHQKAWRFVNFANKNLKVLINNSQRGIAFMEVPCSS